MKKFITGTAISVLSLLAARCGATIAGPAGPATFDMSAIVQTQPFHLANSTTNVTATSTNTMLFYSASTATTHFTASSLLALITNSLGTNFPAGSEIGIESGNFVILNPTNGAIIYRPTAVLNLSYDSPFQIRSGSETFIDTFNANGSTNSESFTWNITASVTYTYDDTALLTTNQTRVQLKGLMVEKVTKNLKSNLQKVTYEFQGTGGGPVQGVQTILNGTINSKASGVIPPG